MIKETQNRKKLSEGRSFGIGFAILKKLTTTKFETLHAFSACKDYLNDLVFVENTNFELNSIHGFKHKKTNVFKNKRYFYLGVNVLNYNHSGKWNRYKECSNELFNNTNNLIKSINNFENILNLFKSRTKIIGVHNIDSDFNNETKALILQCPLFWVKYPILISLFTLFIRLYFNNSNLNGKLEKHKPFIQGDNYYITNFLKLLKLKSFNTLNNCYIYPKEKVTANKVHSNGFINWIKKLNNDKFKN